MQGISKKIIFGIAILLIYSFFSYGKIPTAYACSSGAQTPAQTLKYASLAFVGEAIKTPYSLENPSENSYEFYVTTFEVEKSWKEKIPTTITVQSQHFNNSCDIGFLKGEKYLVFVDNNENSLFVSSIFSSGTHDFENTIEALNRWEKANFIKKYFLEFSLPSVLHSIEKNINIFVPSIILLFIGILLVAKIRRYYKRKKKDSLRKT